MKLNLLFGGLFLFLTTILSAQTATTIHYADYHVEDLNLESTQTLAEITIEPETAGFVIVRMEGICDSDPGDRIVYAVNNVAAWEVNQGNSSHMAPDEDHRIHNMMFSRVFYVSPGTHTYYAVAHNYVNTQGSGIADFKGRMTVAFFSNEESNVHQSPLSLTLQNYESPTQIAGVSNINTSVPGTWFYRLDAQVYADLGKTVQFSIGTEQAMSANLSQTTLVNAPTQETRVQNVCLSNAIDVSGEEASISVMVQVLAEEGLEPEASIYGWFSAFFIPDDWASTHSAYSAQLDGSEEQVLGEMSITIPDEGYIVTQCTGWSDMTPGSILEVIPALDNQQAAYDSTTYLTSVHENASYDSYGITKLLPALEGEHSVKLYGRAHPDAEINLDGEVHGFMYAYFIPDDEALNIAEMKVETLAGYPNPTKDYFQIQALNNSYLGGVWKVYDLNGKLVKSGSITNTNLLIDLNDLANGIWVLQTVSEDQAMMGVSRIVKR